MTAVKERLRRLGVEVPTILLPAPGVDLTRFAVIACDQHSAEPAYWDETEKQVGDAPSALRMILPEAWLHKDTAPKKETLWQTMETYRRDGILRACKEGFLYLRRHTVSGVRRGLMMALDLDAYSYTPGEKTLIRATEQTVPDRLPPRAAIRRGASLEMPHVMVLIDDRDDRLMQQMEACVAGQPALYDFELMQGGGHLTGYGVQNPDEWALVADILEELLTNSRDGLLFAVGDGNHSLAAAKLWWEEKKKNLSPKERETDPARYALVEVVNLYDPAMPFLPIHRLLYGVNPEDVQRELGFSAENPPSLQQLQPKLDAFLQKHPGAQIEYIHGKEECRALAFEAPDRLAILYDTFDRGSVFATVEQNGVFVRKSFSLGEACEKRYYLECRCIQA